MDPKFAQAVEGLHSLLEKLTTMSPVLGGQLPLGMPRSGIYLFSEFGLPLYVGRSRNLRQRYGLHTRRSSQHNQASFAFRLATEAIENRVAPGSRDRASRAKLLENADFAAAFEQAKCRVGAMEFRFVEETNPTRQALLEIYCAVALSTPHNAFDTH